MNSTCSSTKQSSAHSEDQIRTTNETDASTRITSKITEGRLMCIHMSLIRVHIGDRKRNSRIMKMDALMDMNVINVMDGRNWIIILDCSGREAASRSLNRMYAKNRMTVRTIIMQLR